jgi:hypothetical protein
MALPGLTRTFLTSAGAVPACRVVSIGAADNEAILANGSAAPLLGVSEQAPAAPPIGTPIDVILTGVATLEAGAAVGRGAPVTADATGRGVAAAPAAGVNAWVVGLALEAAVAPGDRIRVLLTQSRIQG